MKDFMHLAGCHVFLSPEGGAGGAAPGGDADGGKPDGEGQPQGEAHQNTDDPKAGGKPDGEGGGEDVSGLKSALEKERAEKKELKGELKELRAQIGELEKFKGTAEELQEKLQATSKRLQDYELREAKLAALEAAAKEAAEKGLTVDMDKARAFLKRVPGDDPGELAKEAVELFNTTAEPQRTTKSQPAAPTDVENLSSRDLSRLYRENPEGYQAVMEEMRAKSRAKLRS